MNPQTFTHYKKLLLPISISPLQVRRWRVFWCGTALLLIGVTFLVPSPNLHELQQWQTLLAALLTLGAASIAYHAAMAKVSLDRQLAEQELNRQRVGLHLRLSFALNQLLMDAGKARDASRSTQRDEPIPASDLTVLEPLEIAEAWEHLELFSIDISKRLLFLRATLQQMNRIIAGSSDITNHTIKITSGTPSEKVHTQAFAVTNVCVEIRRMIDAELSINASMYTDGALRLNV
jgi:hypothetical protein